MKAAKEIGRMKKAEILELMRLRGWTMVRLAAELDLTEAAIRRWINEERTPRGPAAILMRQWLADARRNSSAPSAIPGPIGSSPTAAAS